MYCSGVDVVTEGDTNVVGENAYGDGCAETSPTNVRNAKNQVSRCMKLDTKYGKLERHRPARERSTEVDPIF